MGRVSKPEGVLEFLEAARAFRDPSVVFTVAGDDDLVDSVRSAGRNVPYLGYTDRPERYLETLDAGFRIGHQHRRSLDLYCAGRKP